LKISPHSPKLLSDVKFTFFEHGVDQKCIAKVKSGIWIRKQLSTQVCAEYFFKNFSSVRFLNKTWIVWNEFGSVQFEKCGSVRIL